ncbi:MAG: DUF2225 domain-containing protein [Lachnospiraceae bacterium]|nr:DUF2225 domain-containing protein [Lachnospiraceae bacterium]
MSDMLSGLESLGLGGMGKIDIFDDPAKEAQAEAAKKAALAEDAAKKAFLDEKACILEKTCKCRICDFQFKTKTVKTGKAKMVSQDVDLRPRYREIDSVKYGVIACPICGYAALSKNFDVLTSGQAALIKEKISALFTGLPEAGETYTYDDAIQRHKLALVNAVVKHGKTSERAYLCLLLAWLVRAKYEELESKGTPDAAKEVEKLKAEEKDFLVKALEGFNEAYLKENFPLYVLDEQTATYLIAALNLEVGNKEEAMKWAGKIIYNQNASDRIKDKARHIKELAEGKQ